MPYSAIGIPWYHPRDYDRLRAMFPDGPELPDTFDIWLSKAQEIYDRMTNEGYVVKKVFIDPHTFHEWCRVRHRKMNAQTRAQYAVQYVVQGDKRKRRS